jgi:hypothetical protein
MTLLAVNEILKFNGVLDEEYWSVVSYHIKDPFFSVKLYGKPSWVSVCICCSLFTSNSRESSKDRGSLTDTL